MWRERGKRGRHGGGRVRALCVGAAVLGLACKPRPTEIAVFYASSLSAVLSDAAEAFQKEAPRFRLRLEPSGSQVAVRKVSELGMRGDLIAVADANLIPRMLIPGHASWSLVFATNEIVLAHKDHSKLTDQIKADNWPEVLLRADVRLGRVDPDTAPLGYQTLMVWQLAEAAGGPSATDLAAKLAAKCARQHVTHDEAELVTLLEARAIDYAFVFRSTAEDHHLKLLALPPELNLSRPDLAAHYASASVEVRMRQGQGSARIAGAPVTYGLTIPKQAPQAEAAARFVAFLLGERGRPLLERRGLRVVAPATCAPCVDLPASLGSPLSTVASP